MQFCSQILPPEICLKETLSRIEFEVKRDSFFKTCTFYPQLQFS